MDEDRILLISLGVRIAQLRKLTDKPITEKEKLIKSLADSLWEDIQPILEKSNERK